MDANTDSGSCLFDDATKVSFVFDRALHRKCLLPPIKFDVEAYDLIGRNSIHRINHAFLLEDPMDM